MSFKTSYIPLSELSVNQFLTLMNFYDDAYMELESWNPNDRDMSVVIEYGAYPYMMYTFECDQNGYQKKTFEEALE